MSDFLSQDRPIPQKKYAPIPFSQWEKRAVAHEEACRDLDKSADQLLVDIHDESLDKARDGVETIARTLARSAAMQLRVEKEVERQSAANTALNESMRSMTKVILFLAIAATLAGVTQAFFAYASWKASFQVAALK